MKKLVFALVGLAIFAGDMILVTQEANAVVCARGVYRAGCAGPRGAVVTTRRPVYRPHTTVVRRRVY